MASRLFPLDHDGDALAWGARQLLPEAASSPIAGEAREEEDPVTEDEPCPDTLRCPVSDAIATTVRRARVA